MPYQKNVILLRLFRHYRGCKLEKNINRANFIEENQFINTMKWVMNEVANELEEIKRETEPGNKHIEEVLKK